jgi:hypothetical protein
MCPFPNPFYFEQGCRFRRTAPANHSPSKFEIHHMSRKIIFLLGIVIFSRAGAQSNEADYLSTNTYLNNYVQPAPNAGSLGKYVDYPVSYYTGVPEIKIPLYDLNDGAAHLPISLSYHSSGLKVSELASWVGLGWALNAGGMIMRTVRGAPDEGSGMSWGPAPGPSGYYKNYGLSTVQLLPYSGNFGNDLDNSGNAILAIMSGAMDTEPDLFSFNFNGMSGRFVFDENRTPRLLTNDNVQILPNYNGTTFISWTIIGQDGTKYYFGENSNYEVTQPSSYLNGGMVDPRSNYPSNWYLTRIVYPNTKDTIYLNYTQEKYLYRDLAPESKTYDVTSMFRACVNDIPRYDLLQTTIVGWRLTSIQSKNYTVAFVAANQRQDMSSVFSSPLPYTLDSVNIYTSQGQCIKRWGLGHRYFTSTSGSTASAIGALLSQLKDQTDCKRLELTTLTESAGDGSMTKPAYQFSYDTSHQLPRRLSYDQDSWGFCNNAAGNSNYMFTPLVSHPLCTIAPTIGANRNPKYPDMQALVLTGIVDPLGVVTNFQYEAHGLTIGGLRIKQITTTDNLTGLVGVRSFTYSGATLYQTPQYLIVPNNEYYPDCSLQNASMGGLPFYIGYHSSAVYAHNIVKQSGSIVPLQDAQGNHIGYGTVRETFGSRGEGGYKEYYFQTNGSGLQNSRLDMANYTTYTTLAGISGGYATGLMGNGLFNQILPQNLIYHGGFDNDPFYPFSPKQMDFGRGRSGGQNTYDSAGVLLNSVVNTYAETYQESNLIRGLKVFRTPVVVPVPGFSTPRNFDAISYYKLHTGISHLTSTTVTDYKDGKAMTRVTNYAYESAYHTLKTSETTNNSEGDTMIKKTYYSWDYANTASPDNTFAKITARNVLIPISTRTWKNSQLIGGTVTQYQDFATASTDTFLNPVRIYSLEANTPLTTTQAGESISLTGQWSTLLPNSYFVEKADFNFQGSSGRIIEQKNVSDKNQAIIWDNSLHLPIAQIDNAYFSDVAYSSFESAEQGNWTWAAGSVVNDNTAPTGAKAYTLSSSNPIARLGMNTSQTYVVSYWLKSGASISISGGSQSGSISGRTLNGWTYHELKVTGTNSISITGSGNVDELRLYPSTSQMMTYTYDNKLRMIATASVNSTISYYDYDGLDRLIDTKDQFGNITKAYQYNYGRLSR